MKEITIEHYTKKDKNCTHCGGNLSNHYCGEWDSKGIFKIWCDNCGSNNPKSPPNVQVEFN